MVDISPGYFIIWPKLYKPVLFVLELQTGHLETIYKYLITETIDLNFQIQSILMYLVEQASGQTMSDVKLLISLNNILRLFGGALPL